MDPFLENIALVGPKKGPKNPIKPSHKSPLNHNKILGDPPKNMRKQPKY